MKFFTSEWWAGGCENWEIVFRKYEEHFTSIQNRLPRSLVELHERHTLHDSEVKNILCDIPRGAISLTLLGWNRDLEFPVRYVITFLGVSRFEQAFPQQEHVDQELGDLGYWECDLVSEGVEVRVLFVSRAQFTITFSDMEMTYAAVPVIPGRSDPSTT